MKIRLLTNLKVDDTTTLPVGTVVDAPEATAQELLACGAALLEVEVEAAPAPDPSLDPLTALASAPEAPEAPEAATPVLDEMTKGELTAYAKDVLHVALDPNDRWETMLAKVKELVAVAGEV